MSSAEAWNEYANDVQQRSASSRANWKWEFDPPSMILSYGDLPVAAFLCEEQVKPSLEVDGDEFVKAQEELGHRLANILNLQKVRHPLALVTVELNGDPQ